jgi:hypothetical protein
MRLAFFFAALLLPVACASAQTPPGNPDRITWKSPLGNIVYAQESGAAGILEYPVNFGDNIGRFYVKGLAGEFGGSGPLDGYWSEPDVSHDEEDDTTLICPFAIEDDHGRKTRNWGRFRIMFAGDDFPSDFIILRGRCFGDPNDVTPGRLVR